jgi:hypothetical protein
MGSPKDVMVLFAERDLRQLFPEHDRWSVTPAEVSHPAGHFYQISRGKWGGKEVAFIAVSFDQEPKEEVIRMLEGLPDGNGSRTKKYLLTPQATNTATIPPHVRILLMNAFAFAEGGLVWLTKKKNARKFTPEETVAVAA